MFFSCEFPIHGFEESQGLRVANETMLLSKLGQLDDALFYLKFKFQ